MSFTTFFFFFFPFATGYNGIVCGEAGVLGPSFSSTENSASSSPTLI